jgi:hypothetical protein
VHGVLDARLLFLHLGLSSGTDLDDRDAADELRKAFLQLFAIVSDVVSSIWARSLFHPAFDRFLGSGPNASRSVTTQFARLEPTPWEQTL